MIRHFDGFETYGGTGTSAGDQIAATSMYLENNAIIEADANSRFPGSRYLTHRQNIQTILDFLFPDGATDTLTFGVAWRNANSHSATGNSILQLLNDTTIILRIGVDSNGSLRVGRGDFTTNLIAQTDDSIVTIGSWHYFEFEIVRHGSAGELRVWVDGVQRINVTGVNTGASALNRLRFQQGAGATTASRYDDFYFGDAATDHLGDVRVETLYPSADTAQKDWGRSAGSDNHALVDDAGAHNSDTDYVHSSTVGHEDLYEFSNLTTVPLVVHAVMTEIVARKDDTEVRQVRNNLKSGSVTANGATATLTTDYQYTHDLYLEDPDGDTEGPKQWTHAAVNALQAGPEVVA